MTKGCKYFVSADVNGDVITFMVDTGADCSCFPQSLIKNSPIEKMNDPVRIFGFHASSEPHIVDEVVSLELNFEPGTLKSQFMICDTAAEIPIIGADVLRSKSNVSLDTASNLLSIGDDVIHVKPSIRSSKREFYRRKRIGQSEYRRQNECLNGRESWMRVSQRIALPPHSMTYVECEIDGARMPENVFSLMSLYDNDEDNDIVVASYTFPKAQRSFIIPVENRSSSKLVLWKRFALGEIKEHSVSSPNSSDSYDFSDSIITLAELRKNFEGLESSDSDENGKVETQFGNPTVRSKNSENLNLTKTVSSATPVPLSTLKGLNRPSEELMQQFYENGVMMDMTTDKNIPVIEVDSSEIDIEAEMKKSEDCPYWTDKTEYLSAFDLSEFTDDELPHAKNLLWNFRHCFYNPATPSQFQQPLNIKPIKIETLPGIRPKKDKRRTMSAEKQEMLKTHIDRLLAEGVIEELREVENCHASNVVVVVEQRYHAVEKKMVTKSRMTVDMRSLNLAIPSSSYPIPDMESFRRELTQEGFKYFSNLDCQTWYHQLPIDPDCGKKLLGFYALNRIFNFKRLPMGLKVAPSVAQAFIDQAYEPHPHAKGFLDDVTTYSKQRDEMLFKDLPLTLAIASRYSILFKREKADLMKPSTRVLGYDISEGSHCGISNEKIEKIKNLPFPTDKKELVSRLAFFNFFNHTCPRLSEILAPLRRLTRKHVKFKTTDEDQRAFQEAKELLLHPELGAIRTPSMNLDHPVCVFTDASALAYSAIVCQYLPPTSKEQTEEHRLYIVACWSGAVSDTMINFPIYLKELFALAQTFVKYKWFLSFREVIVCTDSQTIQWWTSLGEVSDDVARRLMYIQKFNYKIIYIASCVNPADTFTRLCKTERQGIYEKFAHDRVFNANGEKIDTARLFSEEKRKMSEQFFRQRRQALSKPVERVTENRTFVETRDCKLNDSEDSFIIPPSTDAATVCEASVTLTNHHTGPVEERIGERLSYLRRSLDLCVTSVLQGDNNHARRRCRRRRKGRRKLTRQDVEGSPTMPPVTENDRDDDENDQDENDQDDNNADQNEANEEHQECTNCGNCIPLLSQNIQSNNEIPHCTCVCQRNDRLEVEAASFTISAIEIDDADFEEGRELIDADTLTDDAVSSIPHPDFDHVTLLVILKIQENDDELKECRRYLEGAPLPDKNEALLLSSNIQDFLRNLSSFRLTPQNVITRIWLEPDGKARPLLVLGSAAFMDMLRQLHEFNPKKTTESFAHLGIRKTRKILGKHFYAFKMRKAIEQYIANCPTCRLNNHVVTHRDPQGEQISPEGGALAVIDYVGPWGSFATSGSGRRRFIFVAVDALTRYAYTCVSDSTSDEDTLKHILAIKRQASCLFKKYQMDNAICKKHSKTKKFLEQNGVSISHGLPYNSLSQSKAERFIGTLSRLICKLHTALPTADFQTLVAEATSIYNCSPHDSLPRGLAPRDLHYAQPAATFFNVDSTPISGLSSKPTLLNAVKAAREAGKETLKNDVKSFIRRQKFRSPRNLTSQLQIGDLCLKKRSTFHNSAQKLQFKIDLEAYKIIGKLATNAFKVLNLSSGEISLLSGDVLIRVRGHTKASLLRLVQLMAQTAEDNSARTDGPTTRSRSRSARNASASLDDEALADVRRFWVWTLSLSQADRQAD